MRPLETDRPDGRLISLTHIDFDGAKHNIYRFLLAGGCVAFMVSKSVADMIDFVRGNDIDFIAGSPIHASTLLSLYRGNKVLLPRLKAFRMSSTTVPQELRTQIITRLTPNLYVGYGITEIGIIAIAPPQLVRDRPGVVGWIGSDIEAEIVGPDGEQLAAGSAGELRLRSPGMIDGYLDDPEETAKRFRDGWFYTGDRCEFAPDGALIHYGRADDVIIVDGINIQPTAIESVLLAEPAVAEAVAFGVDSERHGKTPVAAVVLAGNTTRKALYDSAKAKLGLHAPWDIMIVDALPRNTAGKIMKNKLVESYLRQVAATKQTNPTRKHR